MRCTKQSKQRGFEKMANAKYQIEMWKNGAFIARTEESDCIERTKRTAQTLYDALGITCTVFIVRDGTMFASYEWHTL
jgi:hypothetical protein